ncbi:flagellar hook capping FlgD N-terminal domain-containing protein [Oceanicola sp. S124]|uniref:flagellar hook capping FlgD N-terminal domain-containing protein n=1 Tax=Oceanicola sp. S124 TaxID=1042378 RepID=UPI0002558D54|nr:flagellar hook capping FlgD N-terminal domain-containing protein [Oceanicola sp. S124]
MDAITTTGTATSAANSVNTTAKPMISSDFETFLQMLSTQLQNQDPLNPVESADFAVQLATFSSVEQQVLTNNLLESLTGQLVTSSMSDLTSWVGMEALSAAPARWQGAPVTLAPNPLTAADTAILVVRNAAGNVVYEGEVPLGTDPVDWDGTDTSGNLLPHGRYTFELENYAEGDLLATDVLESYSPIVEARIIAGSTLLVTSGGDLIETGMVSGLRQPRA